MIHVTRDGVTSVCGSMQFEPSMLAYSVTDATCDHCKYVEYQAINIPSNDAFR